MRVMVHWKTQLLASLLPQKREGIGMHDYQSNDKVLKAPDPVTKTLIPLKL
jgi:hypothetical protein